MYLCLYFKLLPIGLMKNQILLPSIVLFTILALYPSKNSYSQGFYFSIGGGYGLNSTNITNVDLCQGFNQVPYPGSYNLGESLFTFVGANQTYSQTFVNGQETWSNTYQPLNKGFGGGFSFLASVGYSFTKNISAELEFSYISGTTLQSTFKDSYYAYATEDTDVENATTTNKLTSSPRYRLMPSLKLSVPISSKLCSYLKAGLVVGLGGKLTLSNIYLYEQYLIQNGQTYDDFSETTNVGLTASGGLSLGYTASAGAEYSFSDFLSVYLELNFINENWSPTNGNITSYSVSTASPPVTLSSTQFSYSNNISLGGGNFSSGSVIQVNSQYPKQIFSYGSYGLVIGIKFSIPHKKPSPPDITPPATTQKPN